MCADLTEEETRKLCMERLSPRDAATYTRRVVGGGFTSHVTNTQAVKDEVCDVLVNQPQNNAWVAGLQQPSSEQARP
jgi:hypothetical protein